METKFQELSFKATVMFSAVCLSALLLAGLFFMLPAVVIFALLACGATYVAQLIATMTNGESNLGLYFQGTAVFLWAAGFCAFLFGAF